MSEAEDIQMSNEEKQESSEINQDDDNFIDGEEVLAYHGTALYKAKILKVEEKNGAFSYFIHYHGWNKKYA